MLMLSFGCYIYCNHIQEFFLIYFLDIVVDYTKHSGNEMNDSQNDKFM